nr:hypothetical protein [Actinomycetales bacterium]
MIVMYIASLLMLMAATVVVMVRAAKGPSMLDRAVSVDIVTAALIGFTSVFSVLMDRTDLLKIIAALAVVGFLSTVSIARFAANESDVDRHILSREELEELGEAQARLADDAAPVHDVDALAEEAAAAEAARDEVEDEVAVAGAPGAQPDAVDRAPDHRAIRRKGEER